MQIKLLSSTKTIIFTLFCLVHISQTAKLNSPNQETEKTNSHPKIIIDLKHESRSMEVDSSKLESLSTDNHVFNNINDRDEDNLSPKNSVASYDWEARSQNSLDNQDLSESSTSSIKSLHMKTYEKPWNQVKKPKTQVLVEQNRSSQSEIVGSVIKKKKKFVETLNKKIWIDLSTKNTLTKKVSIKSLQMMILMLSV